MLHGRFVRLPTAIRIRFTLRYALFRKLTFFNCSINRLHGRILRTNIIWKKVKFQIFTFKFHVQKSFEKKYIRSRYHYFHQTIL